MGEEVVPWYAPFIKAANAGAYLVAHVFVALILIGAIFVIQLLLQAIGDPKLFDWLPLRYIFDGMDLGILAAFLLFGTVGAYYVFREQYQGFKNDQDRRGGQ